MNNGLDLYPLSHIEKTHAFGSVNLMAAHGQQINLHPSGQYPELAKALYRVHMEENPGIFALDQRPRLRYGLQRSTSLLVCITETRMVSGRIAFSRSCSEIRPQASTGRYVT